MILLVLAASASAASATGDGFAYIDVGCAAMADGNTAIYWGLEKQDCAKVSAADRNLNVSYRNRIKTLKPDRRKALAISQRKWLKNTIIICKLSADMSIADPDEAKCFSKEWQSRVKMIVEFS